MNLWIDCETFSRLDLKAVGVYRYAKHPSTELLLVTYAVGPGAVQTWSPAEGEAMPPALLHWLLMAETRTAHNSQFDRNVIPRCLHRMGIITASQMAEMLSPRGWRCTMTKALAHALPADLDTLGRVLGLRADQAKLADGKKLIQRFCKPAPANHKADRYNHVSHPELWARFRTYAATDVVAMRECDRMIPDWNMGPRELELWFLDQKINDRGFQCDVALVDAAVSATEQEKMLLARRFVALTRGLVTSPSQREKFKAFLEQEHDVFLENTQAETLKTVRRRYADGSPVAELLDIAVQSNKSSTSKYVRLQTAIDEDGRFRGGLQFAGAGRTRRWGGRGFQPHNLPSRGLPKADMVELYIVALILGIHAAIFDKLMWYGSAALRGVVTTLPGRHIVAADLSNIEGRVLAWIAGEMWKIQAFRDYDAGTGPDLYKVTAGIITGVDPWKVEKSIRNSIGKVSDLASGYQGGVAGYQKFADAYGVRLADYWSAIKASVAPEHLAKAHKNLAKSWGQRQINELGISEVEWLASETCKLAWRSRHPATVSFWYDLQNATLAAVRVPGSTHVVTQLKISCREYAGHMWLQILLPSGNRLCYFHPELYRKTKVVEFEDGTWEEQDDGDESLTYWAMSTEEGGPRIWQRTFTHGGKLTGNVCQTIARDVLAYNMPAIEDAGYDIVLTVHDEVVGDAPADKDEEEMVRLLATNPPWSAGLPLAAAGFSSNRYKKED
jgi:DNA polymerase